MTPSFPFYSKSSVVCYPPEIWPFVESINVIILLLHEVSCVRYIVTLGRENFSPHISVTMHSCCNLLCFCVLCKWDRGVILKVIYSRLKKCHGGTNCHCFSFKNIVYLEFFHMLPFIRHILVDSHKQVFSNLSINSIALLYQMSTFVLYIFIRQQNVFYIWLKVSTPPFWRKKVYLYHRMLTLIYVLRTSLLDV